MEKTRKKLLENFHGPCVITEPLLWRRQPTDTKKILGQIIKACYLRDANPVATWKGIKKKSKAPLKNSINYKLKISTSQDLMLICISNSLPSVPGKRRMQYSVIRSSLAPIGEVPKAGFGLINPYIVMEMSSRTSI